MSSPAIHSILFSPTKKFSDELLSRAEAAEYLGVTKSTLAVWASVKRYGLPYVKMGRLVKYRKTALDAFIENRTVKLYG